MALPGHPTSPPKLLAQIAVAGVTLAVLALGGLAVWTALVSQNGAASLSQAGVQTSGHLRVVQALSTLDTSTDALEETDHATRELAKVSKAQRVLDDAVDRMESGGVRETSQLAEKARPLIRQLRPAVTSFLANRSRAESAATVRVEADMDALITELQVLMNDFAADPSQLLGSKLESVTASERTVGRTAFLLIPLGLGSVVACAWLLSSYRRRSEAAMRSALETTEREARTDQLTGLPNRRALLEELGRRTDDNQSFTLALADLNGFKRYNDTFGHPAGDALLRRLGLKLATACEGRGLAARLGGDEFCVLLVEDMTAPEVQSLVGRALSEVGEGFHITAESGVAAVPADARDPETALHIADARMYAEKANWRPSSGDAMSKAMMRMLNEHHPGLASHVKDVAKLAAGCAEALGLPEHDVRSVERAAELHDVGKVAIPSTILTKQGPLNDEEWEFMRRHSLIGERILSGIPSLKHAASMVRSSHERWDGRGYPDALSGEAIPIGARIIFVADAYSAMTEERPYAQARSVDAARRELSACSGTQFDPAVVTAFLAGLDRQEAQADVQALAPV